MSPTDGHLHHVSRASMTDERRAHGPRVEWPATVDRRMKAWRPHGRITLAESPELYMREEMI